MTAGTELVRFNAVRFNVAKQNEHC